MRSRKAATYADDVSTHSLLAPIAPRVCLSPGKQSALSLCLYFMPILSAITIVFIGAFFSRCSDRIRYKWYLLPRKLMPPAIERSTLTRASTAGNVRLDPTACTESLAIFTQVLTAAAVRNLVECPVRRAEPNGQCRSGNHPHSTAQHCTALLSPACSGRHLNRNWASDNV